MAVETRGRRILRRLRTGCRAIASVFSPRNMKNAFKSVTKDAKAYICFFVAVFALQVGFVTFALMTDTNIQYAKRTVTEEYSHHLEVVGLDQEQKVNLAYTLDLAITRLDPYIQSASIHQEIDETYTVRITLRQDSDLSAAKAHVLSKDIMGQIASVNTDTGTPWSLRTTPLYTYENDYATAYTLTYIALFILWTLLSVGVIWVLYRIRTEHFRFIYGVYMSCGADFPKLYGTAGGELLAVSLLTLLPAALLGAGVTVLAYVPRGVPLGMSGKTVVGLVIYDLLVILLSAYLPMRKLSLQPPVKHLLADDHTGLVSSPRRSFRMFGAGYPVKYELFGLWRLRKYYVGLLLSAVLFAAMFVSGLYLADLEKEHAETDPYEYLVHYTASTVSDGETESGEDVPSPTVDREDALMIAEDLDIFLEDIRRAEGVSYVDWAVTTSGSTLASHLLITPSQLAGGTDSLVRSSERESQGYQYAMSEFAYTAFDKLYIDMLVEEDLCTFEGDPYALLTGERQVIISEDSFNQQAYSFSPGDKVLLAVFEKANGAIELVPTPAALLRMQIEKFDFKYVEYTVCAVMRGRTSENRITFGLTFDEYEELTGAYPLRDQLRVYFERGSDFDTVRAAEDTIRRALQYCSGWQVTPTGNYFKAETNNQKQDSVMIYVLAILLLVISPLVWFFSQIMYYRKRRGEFHILLALGAEEKSISTLHRITGGVLSGIAFLITVALSSLCNALVHLAVNTLLPKFGLLPNVGYDYELSVPALIACVVVSVICGFMSCEIPYRMFQKSKRDGTVEVK